MDKIQGATATPDRKFTLGVPEVGSEGTIVTAEWLNHVQDEICNVILSENMSLDDSSSQQLSAAIKQKLNALKQGCEQDIVGFKTEVEQWKKQIQSTILTLAKESELKRLQAITDTDKTNLLQCFEILNNFNNEFVEKVLQFLKTLEQNYFIQDSRFTEVFNAYGTYVLKHVGAKLNESAFQKFLDTSFKNHTHSDYEIELQKIDKKLDADIFQKFVFDIFKNHKHPEPEKDKLLYHGYSPYFESKVATDFPKFNKLVDISKTNITKSTSNLMQIPTFCLEQAGFYRIIVKIDNQYDHTEMYNIEFGTLEQGVFYIKETKIFEKQKSIEFEFKHICLIPQEVAVKIKTTRNSTLINNDVNIIIIKQIFY